MKNKYDFEKFEIDFSNILNAFTANNLIKDSIISSIKTAFKTFKDKTMNNFETHKYAKNKIIERKKQEAQDYKTISTNLNNKYLVRKENIKKINKKNILQTNQIIHQKQNECRAELDSLYEQYQAKIEKTKANIEPINKAYDLNLKHLEKNLNMALESYSTFLDKKALETNNIINKIHSSYSKQIIISNEEDNAKILNIEKQIKAKKDELVKLDAEFDENKNLILQKKLLTITNLNNDIRDKTKQENIKLKSEKENNIIKQKDIEKQLLYYEDEFNDKSQQILSNFINELNTLDETNELTERQYKNDCERIKREYFYTYYSLNNELNNYLKNINKETNESLKIRLINKRLIKLKINTFYQKIKEIKFYYNTEMAKLKSNYDDEIAKNNLAKRIAEINKNYELEMANIEFNTMKDNNTLLSEFVSKQIALNQSNISNYYEYEIIKSKNKYGVEIATYDKEINLLQATHQYLSNKIRLEILDLKALENQIYNIMQLREEYYNNSSFEACKLEQIISNLELDRNAKINEYNHKQYAKKIKIVELYKNLQLDKIDLRIDYIKEDLKLKRKLINMRFAKERLPYVNRIDEIRTKEIYYLEFEDCHYTKNTGLAELNHNRKNYRFDALLLNQNGSFVFLLLDDLITLLKEITKAISEKLDQTNYSILYNNLTTIIFNYYSIIFKNFNDSEILVLEERIQNETKNTHKIKKDDLTINYKASTAKLQTKIEDFNKLINKYDITTSKYLTKINNLNYDINKIRENTNIISFIFDRDRKKLAKELIYYKKGLKKIKHSKHNVANLIIGINKKIKNTQKDYNKTAVKYDKLLKNEYLSSYILVGKANNILRKVTNKINHNKNIFLNHNFDNSSFNKLFNLNKKSKYLYLKIFKNYKNDNENKFQNKQRNLVSNFKKDLRKHYKSSFRHIKNINDNYYKTRDKIINLIHNTNTENANLDSTYNNEYNELLFKHKRKLTKCNKDQDVIRKTYTSILYSITNNISNTRSNYAKFIKVKNNNFNNDLEKIKANYRNEIKANSTTLENYKIRLNLDNTSIPNNCNKQIDEIKANQKLSKNKYNYTKAKNNYLKKKVKKQYQRERVKNISKNTNVLLKQKLILDRTLNKIKQKKKKETEK